VTRTKVEAYLSLHSRQPYSVFMLNVMVQLYLMLLFTSEHNKLLTINDKQLNS